MLIASIASVVNAVDKLLLGERLQNSMLGKICTLNRPSGRKSPARSTLLLILNVCDTAFLDPINLFRKVTLVLRLNLFGRVFFDKSEQLLVLALVGV